MNMRDVDKSYSNYVNINNIPSSSSSSTPSCYMNVDVVARGVKSLNVETPQLYTNLGHIEYPKPALSPASNGGGGYGNYMNMTLVNTEPEKREPGMRKPSIPEQPIYDTPTNHVRAYANVDNKMIAMSVSNPIYGNTAQKLKT